MGLGVPVADEHRDIDGGLNEGRRHSGRAEADGAIATGSSLEARAGEVEETAHLILHLKLVRPVPMRRNLTVRPQHPILP